jgi:IMP dehydrogenase
MQMRTNLSFDDVLIEPQLGIVDHRYMVNLSTMVGRVPSEYPVLSAPMDTVTGYQMAIAIERSGGIGVLHRFQSISNQVADYQLVKASIHDTRAFCAIGINEGVERLEALRSQGCNNFVLDVAHAHQVRVIRFLETLPDGLNLIVGSVATAKAIQDLAMHYPIAGYRVGIGPGAACITRETTGAGVPQLSAIMDCAEMAQEFDATIIADGGIRTSGDIVKAIIAGADAVMLGYLLAGAKEAPKQGKYWGMASSEVSTRTPEGVTGTVPLTGPVSKTIETLMGGVASGISYAGGNSLKSVQGKTDLFLQVTPATMLESRARI